jgi:hypothetical protein
VYTAVGQRLLATALAERPWYVRIFNSKICNTGIRAYFCTPFINSKAMAVTRLKRKNRKDKAKSAVRRQSLKLQNFQPVMKTVDVEKIKEEFKAKKKA